MTSLSYSPNLTIGIKFNLPYCYIITLRPSVMIEICYDSMFFAIHLHRGEYSTSVEGGAITVFVFKTAQIHVLNALSHFQI